MRARCTLHVIHCKLHVELCILHIVLHCFVAPIMFSQLILLHICWISSSSLSSLLSAYIPTDQRTMEFKNQQTEDQVSRFQDQRSDVGKCKFYPFRQRWFKMYNPLNSSCQVQISEGKGLEQSWQRAKTISKSGGKGVGYLYWLFYIF